MTRNHPEIPNEPRTVSVNALTSGTLLVIAPHMDDEIIGCGGLMLLHTDKRRVHCLYASDGAKSPRPLLPWQGRPPMNITDVRKREAEQALAEIGLPKENMNFLNLPDGRLGRRSVRLREKLADEISRIEPEFVLVPFRYDLHSDHVAVQRAVRDLSQRGCVRGTVLEYFVYVRWALVPGADIRQHLRQDRLTTVDISSVASRKRRSLGAYRSQTEVMCRWQDSPVLTAESVRQRSEQPERFLLSSPTESLTACVAAYRYGIPLAHYAQRYGKRRKDQLVAVGREIRGTFGWNHSFPANRD